jgi:pantoate--beta-alanine ligase
MGNLHQGHLSLCSRSALDNEVTIVTIYVNPQQFNDPQDFSRYPRTIDADKALLNAHGGVDYCLILADAEIYADDYHYQIHERHWSQIMEGQYRPGHFTGMLTIVLKLLLGIGPCSAYFGEKDYQQYLLIQRMQAALFLDCEIIPCPIIREESGLPFSSRNRRLSASERQLADEFAILFLQKHLSLSELKTQIQALGMRIDYCEEHLGRRFIAVRIGQIRLLDNYALED